MSLQNYRHGPQELCGRCSRDQRLQILAAQDKLVSTAPKRLPWAGLGCAGSGCTELGPGRVALDTFQGFGCDMVLLCTVRGDQTGIIGFFAVPGRFNVAMRRGKRVLMVFWQRELSWSLCPGVARPRPGSHGRRLRCQIDHREEFMRGKVDVQPDIAWTLCLEKKRVLYCVPF